MTVNGSRSAGVAGPSGSNSEGLVATVVDAVARERGVDAVELPPLYESIDPDALNALFEPTEVRDEVVTGVVHFEYAGCAVEAYADGRVAVESIGLV